MVGWTVQHDKTEATSEIRGFVTSVDEVAVYSGTLIVGRDSRFLCHGAARIAVLKDATLALMDGAMAGHSRNEHRLNLYVAPGGAITGGMPDRPLKRDARYGLSYHDWMNRNSRNYGQYSAEVSGRLIGYPAKESDARLVFGWHRVVVGPDHWGGMETYAKMVPKIMLWFKGDAEVENVRFEDLHRGGILMPDAAAARKWKNVTFGAGCLSNDPKELIREYKGKFSHNMAVDLLPGKKYTSM